MRSKSLEMAIIAVVIILFGIVVSTIFIFRQRDSEQVVVYSGRNENFVLPLIKQFEEQTGVKVRLLSGNATSLAHRIAEQRNNQQADVFLANDAGIMEYLRRQNVLSPINSPRLKNIPPEFRAEDATWTGLSGRARIFMYNLDLLDETEVPQSIFDLTDPRYRGQFAITRSGNASMVSHIAAVRNFAGDAATVELLRGILANDPVITRGHTDIRRMVGAGEVKFGLVNNYYYHLQLHEERNNRVGAVYPDQGSGQMGVFVNVAGLALITGGPNMEHARAFADFMLATERQRMFAETSKETPLAGGVPVPEYARAIDQYRHADSPLGELGEVWSDTLDLMERAGYVD